MRKFVFLCAVAAFSLAGTARAELITGRDTTTIVAVAKKFGDAELTKDSEGDPKITGNIDGTKYTLYFNGCSKGENCTDIVFRAGWTGSSATAEDMHSWNKNKRWGKAYLDEEGDPNVEVLVNLEGGVSRKNLMDSFDWWRLVIKEFSAALN